MPAVLGFFGQHLTFCKCREMGFIEAEVRIQPSLGCRETDPATNLVFLLVARERDLYFWQLLVC